MLIKNRPDLTEQDVTPEKLYLNRRQFIGGAAALGALGLVPPAFAAEEKRVLEPLDHIATSYGAGESLTGEDAVTGYNNFYEFGTDKADPAKNAWRMRVKPWSVRVDGLTERAGDYALEDLIDFKALEERIYRLRCVEAWSMVIPWIGVPLAGVLKKLAPKSDAGFVLFETLNDRKQMPKTRWPTLKWPYREGLRMDEAMNPLAFLAVGLYGKQLPNQNGAPLRLVVPWKYGFKSIKSIVRISFQARQPKTSWEMSQPGEYGFYSNVNPAVDHPRWSQARERRIGEFGRRKTLMFNGYADQVAGLYAGMDLKKQY